MEQAKGEAQFVLDDVLTGTQLSFDYKEGIISVKDLEEALEVPPRQTPKEESEEEKNKRLEAEAKARKAQLQREALEDQVLFEERFWAAILDTGADGKPVENPDAFYVVESMFQYDPVRCAERLEYMDFAKLQGARLAHFFNTQMDRNLGKLFAHIDEKIKTTVHLQNLKTAAQSLSKLAHDQVLEETEKVLPQVCLKGVYEKYYKKQGEMIRTAVCRGTVKQTKWINHVKQFMVSKDKDEIAVEMFHYADKLAEASQKIVKVESEHGFGPLFPKAEETPKETSTEGTLATNSDPPKTTQPAQPLQPADPSDFWVSPVIFSLMILQPRDLKALYKFHRKL